MSPGEVCWSRSWVVSDAAPPVPEALAPTQPRAVVRGRWGSVVRPQREESEAEGGWALSHNSTSMAPTQQGACPLLYHPSTFVLQRRKLRPRGVEGGVELELSTRRSQDPKSRWAELSLGV